MAPPGNQAANREDKAQPEISEETCLLARLLPFESTAVPRRDQALRLLTFETLGRLLTQIVTNASLTLPGAFYYFLALFITGIIVERFSDRTMTS